MFDKLFIDDLKRIYWAEKQQISLLRKMEKAAATRYLKASFRGHLEATGYHIKRLGELFGMLGKKPAAQKCPVLTEIAGYTACNIRITKKQTLLRELSLISAAQKIERYEMEQYGRLISVCSTLAKSEAAALLGETLSEEEEAEEVFAAIKEDALNDEQFRSGITEAESPLNEEDEEDVFDKQFAVAYL